MGIRHLTIVVAEGDYKVAQYGQWDGYPSGQGKTVLRFIHDNDMQAFKQKLANVQWITEEEHDAALRSVGAPDGMLDMDQHAEYVKRYPELTRDTGADILDLIMKSEELIKLSNSIKFAADSLFCEWAWLINLDSNELEVYKGFNREPLPDGERFKGIDPDAERGEYHEIKFVRTFTFDELKNISKDEFIEVLEPAEAEDEG